MRPSAPILSLVMTSRDAAATIGDALASVEAAAGSIEIIVADGGSRDATREIAARYPLTRVLAGGDAGIYAGFNRGIAAAEGRLLGFLNADDMLLPGALDAVCCSFAEDCCAVMASGDVLLGATIGSAARLRNETPLKTEGAIFGVPAWNGRFFRTGFAKRHLRFDEEIGLAADRKALIELCRARARSVRIDRPVYFYRAHAASRTIAGDRGARSRVLAAERALAKAMLAEPPDEGRKRALLEAHGVLTDFKSAWPTAGAMARVGLSGGRPLFRGLRAWHRWRGRLAGY